MPITALPPAPSRDDPETFADLGDAWVAALATWTTEANTLETTVNAKEASAVASAAAALVSETNAAASATAAATNSQAIAWVTGTVYAVGNLRYSPADFQSYRRITAGAGATDPSLDTTNWVRVSGVNMVRVGRTSNVVLAFSNLGNLIDVTGASTFTQTFNAAASLGANWFVWYRNSGTGVVTLTGLSLTVSPGEVKLVHCDGATIRGYAISSGATMTHEERTTNTSINTADWGKLIEYTGATTITQTFDAIAGFPAGFNVTLFNNGTGIITLDPNGAELIDTLASFKMYPGEKRNIYVKTGGASWESTVDKPFDYWPAATFTFQEPPGYLTGWDVWLHGPGGGGGAGRRGAALSARFGGAAGGSGVAVRAVIPVQAIGGSIVVTFGAVGVGSAAIGADNTNGGNGTAGGTTSFGSLLRALGGNGGDGGASAASSTGGTQALGAGYDVMPSGTGGGVTISGGNPTNGSSGGQGNIAGTGTGWGGTGGGGAGSLRNDDAFTTAGAATANGSADSTTQIAGGIAGTVGSRPGGNGNNPTGNQRRAGTGGGGGYASATTAAGAGGTGGNGSGGGGGGASLNGFASGKGGDGGPSIVNIRGVL